MSQRNNCISLKGFKSDFQNSPCTMERESSLKASLTDIEKELFSMWTEWSSCDERNQEQSQRWKYFEAVRNN